MMDPILHFGTNYTTICFIHCEVISKLTFPSTSQKRYQFAIEHGKQLRTFIQQHSVIFHSKIPKPLLVLPSKKPNIPIRLLQQCQQCPMYQQSSLPMGLFQRHHFYFCNPEWDMGTCYLSCMDQSESEERAFEKGKRAWDV